MTYFRRNRELDITLESNTSLNRAAFFKLLALGLFDILLTLPLSIIQFVEELLQVDITGFWPGWKVAHASFSTIPTFNSEEWKASGFWTVFNIKYSLWINPIYAVAFFLLFGITEKKRAWYRSLFWKAMLPLGLKPRVSPAASNIEFGSVPMFTSVTNNIRGTVM